MHEIAVLEAFQIQAVPLHHDLPRLRYRATLWGSPWSEMISMSAGRRAEKGLKALSYLPSMRSECRKICAEVRDGAGLLGFINVSLIEF
jgi:hypothetical protein